jgi:hypothetical protein
MAYLIPAEQNIGNQFYTITGLIQLVSGNNPPASISLPTLGNPPGATTNLGVRQGATIDWSPNPAVTRSFGLISCASVCFVNTATGIAYVYHANAGSVPDAEFNDAMDAIGAAAPYNTVYIAYAHPNNTDRGYQDCIARLVARGIPTNNIVEISNLLLGQFGLNNNLQIGY